GGAGRLADRVPLGGPRIGLGYFIAVVVRPVIAVTGAAWQVIGLRVVDRLGKGLRTPPRDALIADVTPAELRGRAFGLQRGMDHAGAVLGPILAWWLLAPGGGGANVRAVIAGSIVPGVAVLGLASGAVVGGWAAVHVVRSSSSFLGGAASDRLGPGQTMWVGWLVYAMLAVGMARAGTAAAAWGLFLALGLVAGLTESPERALVARLAGTHQGSGFGLYHGITGFAALVGGVALGGVFQRYGAA